MSIFFIWFCSFVFFILFCGCECYCQQILAPMNNDTLRTNRPIQMRWNNQVPNTTFSLFFSQNQLMNTIVSDLKQTDNFTWQVPLLDTTEVSLILQTTTKDFLQPILWWKQDSVVPTLTEIRKVFVHSSLDSFFFSTSNSSIEEWDIATSSRVRSETFGVQTSSQASYSNDTFTLLSNDNMLYYIDRNTRQFSVKGFQDPHISFIRDIAYSPSNDLLATASNDGTVKIRNLTTDQIITTISVPTITSMYSVSFSTDGQTIVFAGNDGAIYLSVVSTAPLYRATTEKHGLNGLNLVVWDCNFSPDNQRIVSGGVDGIVKVWDASDLSLISSLTGHTFHVRSTHFSPDNSVIASIGLDSTLLIFDAISYQQLYEPIKHSHSLLDMQFFGDSKRIITVGRGSTVSIWKLPTETIFYDTVKVVPKYPISIFIPTITASVGERVSVPVRYSVQSKYPSFIDVSLVTSESRFFFLPLITNWKKLTPTFLQQFQSNLFNEIGLSSNTLPAWRSTILFSQYQNNDSIVLSSLRFANTFFVIDTVQNGMVLVDSLCIQNPLYPTIALYEKGLTLLVSTKSDEIELKFTPIEIGIHHLVITSVDGLIFEEKFIDVSSNLDVSTFNISKSIVPNMCIISLYSPTEHIVQKINFK